MQPSFAHKRPPEPRTKRQFGTAAYDSQPGHRDSETVTTTADSVARPDYTRDFEGRSA